MPDFERLFKQVGIILETKNEIDFGASVRSQKIMSNPKVGSSAYEAGFQEGDKLIRVGLMLFEGSVSINSRLNTFKVGEIVPVVFERFGVRKETSITIKTEVNYDIRLMNPDSKELTSDMKKKRANWLESKL